MEFCAFEGKGATDEIWCTLETTKTDIGSSQALYTCRMDKLLPLHSSSSKPHRLVHAVFTCVILNGRWSKVEHAQVSPERETGREGRHPSISNAITNSFYACIYYSHTTARSGCVSFPPTYVTCLRCTRVTHCYSKILYPPERRRQGQLGHVLVELMAAMKQAHA